ncbi:hypothetical protein [Nonomuraea fuscirosea]|uniref:hypothetical protein n=1 Tax=Nonomuraea fuscirosea TaxID=1291556 RepID=UPI0011B27457|nr:hypothetical protein [Nonomuraea fuscirosea]
MERDQRLRLAASALEEALAAQNSWVESTAEKWLGANTAIFGLFSLAGIATAKDALNGLGKAQKWLVAIALLTAVGAAAGAVTLGYRAAYGWPRMVSVEGEDLLKWYAETRSYAPRAIPFLHRALFLSFASLGALTVVMLLVWLLPRG